MRNQRQRGFSLIEAVAATSLAVTFIALFATQLGSDAAALRHATEDARARAALLAAYERLQAGLSLEAPGGPIAVTLERTATTDRRLIDSGLVPVVLKASWKAADGKPRSRELATLVAEGGAR